VASELRIRPGAAGLSGSVPLAADDAVLLARMSLAVLSRGTTTLTVRDVYGSSAVLLEGLARLGVEVRHAEGALTIVGLGLGDCRAPDGAMDVRGEPAAAAALLSLLVARDFASELWVDEVVVQLLAPALLEEGRDRVEALSDTSGGAKILLGAVPKGTREPGAEFATTGVFAWVKQAVLLAGLRRGTPTLVQESLASCDHLERALLRTKMPFQAEGTVCELHPPRDEDASAPQIYKAIGSPTLASFLGSAALLRGDADLKLRDVCLNPTRADFLTAARLMGADVSVQPKGDLENEPYGDVLLRGRVSRPLHCGGELSIRLGDEVFALMALAARIEGTSTFEDIVPQSRGGDPRIVGRVAGLLRSAGAVVETRGASVSVTGVPSLRGIKTTTGGDGRLALLGSILAVSAEGESCIDNVDCLRQVFPRWVGTLRAIGVDLELGTA